MLSVGLGGTLQVRLKMGFSDQLRRKPRLSPTPQTMRKPQQPHQKPLKLTEPYEKQKTLKAAEST